MADLSKSLKEFWMKGMEAIGNTASNIATNTRTKVDELTMVNRRRDILADFGSKAYALWQKGEHFPQELQEELEELSRLDEKLNDLRAERLAGVSTQSESEPQEDATDTDDDGSSEIIDSPEATDSATEEDIASVSPAETPETEDSFSEAAPCVQTEEAALEESTVPVLKVEPEETSRACAEPLSAAINDLFDQASQSVVPSSDPIEQVLDELDQNLADISRKTTQELNDLTTRMDEKAE